MNSYMLPHGTRVRGQAAQHDAHQQQPDADVDQCQPGLADALVERALRRRSDDARGGAIGADRRADQLAALDLAATAVRQLDGE